MAAQEKEPAEIKEAVDLEQRIRTEAAYKDPVDPALPQLDPDEVLDGVDHFYGRVRGGQVHVSRDIRPEYDLDFRIARAKDLRHALPLKPELGRTIWVWHDMYEQSPHWVEYQIKFRDQKALIPRLTFVIAQDLIAQGEATLVRGITNGTIKTVAQMEYTVGYYEPTESMQPADFSPKQELPEV